MANEAIIISGINFGILLEGVSQFTGYAHHRVGAETHWPAVVCSSFFLFEKVKRKTLGKIHSVTDLLFLVTVTK